MKPTARYFSLMLAGLLVLGALSGCANGSSGDDQDTEPTSELGTSSGTLAETNTEEAALVESTLQELQKSADWGGKDFGILYTNDISGYTEEIEATEKAGDDTASGVINDAVYRRNTLFEEYANLNFSLIPVSNNAVASRLSGEAQTATGDFHIVTYTTSGTAAASTSGSLYNYLDLSIDYDTPWWDAGTLEFAMNGRVFFMNGPFNIVDDDVTYIMMFNKQLREDYKIADLYSVVKKNEWTLDYFNSGNL